MSEKKFVLIAGASGYLGKFIVKELKKQNYFVRALVRNIEKIRDMAEIIDDVFIGEVTEPSSIRDCCKDIDIVISTVGITVQKDGLKYMDVDYQANVNLLDIAKRSNVSKFIYISSLNGDKLTHLKISEAKEKFVENLKNSGLDHCIMRPNGFYSDMSEFLIMAKKGKVMLFGDGNYKINPIHGADLAEVCVNAIKANDSEIEVGGPKVYTYNEIAGIASDIMNKNAKVTYYPEWMRKLILCLVRTFSSSMTYGPIEFFFTVLSMDMIAPTYGKHFLEDHFKKIKDTIK
jgi:uncharacterized protein YbjT (DUF2867 family)